MMSKNRIDLLTITRIIINSVETVTVFLLQIIALCFSKQIEKLKNICTVISINF